MDLLQKLAIFLAALVMLVAIHLIASSSGGPSVNDVPLAETIGDEFLDDFEDEVESKRGASGEEEELSDDITFLFAVIDMNRRTHMGIENYTFEKDYLEQVKGFLRNYRPEKMQIIMQRKYYPNLEDLIYEGVHVRFVELEDLRSWRFYEGVERIRTSDWWSAATPWLSNVPQGYSDLYNPIVMHKLLWLRDLSVLNPFKTKYFVWLDSGGICTPRIRDGIQSIPEFKTKAKYVPVSCLSWMFGLSALRWCVHVCVCVCARAR
jgi:hypothetical protein